MYRAVNRLAISCFSFSQTFSRHWHKSIYMNPSDCSALSRSAELCIVPVFNCGVRSIITVCIHIHFLASIPPPNTECNFSDYLWEKNDLLPAFFSWNDNFYCQDVPSILQSGYTPSLNYFVKRSARAPNWLFTLTDCKSTIKLHIFWRW